MRWILLSLIVSLPATADLTAVERAVEQYRLGDAEALLQKAPASADAAYLRARIALARYQGVAASAAVIACHALAHNRRQQARCFEVEAEALAYTVAESNELIEQVDSARAAQDLLANAADLDPDNARVQMQRARNYRLLPWFVGGSDARAERNVAAAIARHPELAAQARGIDAYYAGNDARAITELAAATRAAPLADASYHLALAQARSGKQRAAIATLTRLTTAFGEFWEAWFQLGRVAAAVTGREAEARLALRRFVDGAPAAAPKRRANAFFLLGQIAERTGDRAGAVQAYRSALATRPGHNESQAALQALTAKVAR